MHVLIHEPNSSGHRFTTVRVLLDALLQFNAQTQLLTQITFATTEQALESDEFREQINPILENITLHKLRNVKHSALPSLKTHRQLMGLRECLLSIDKVDHLYLPYADYQLQLLCLYRRIPGVNWWPPKTVTEAQLMQSTFAYSFTKKSRQFMSLMAIKYSGCDRVHLNDPIAMDYLRENHSEVLNHVKGIPDPITQTVEVDKTIARSFLGLPSEARIVGCLGAINERKGGDVLVNAFVQANLNESDILLLAGRFSPTLKALVKSKGDKRIICIDRYLTEEELSYAISAMDLVVTPYRQARGSASIIIRAAVCNRMVLSSDTGWAGAVVPLYELGTTCSILDIALFAKQLKASLEQSIHFKSSKKALKFVRYNSEENVREHWIALLKTRLGLKAELVALDS